MVGRVCAADEAFYRLQHDVARLGELSTWAWFAERFRDLEAKLEKAGGFDEDLAELIESPHGYLGYKETVDRYFETEGIGAEIEDLVGAFFVSLQPRLNAVRVAARRVFEAATQIDCIKINCQAPGALPTDAELAWQIANYVKHNDEWGAVLERRQQITFDALVRLGVAQVCNGQREYQRWVLSKAACKLANADTLETAVSRIVAQCIASCDELVARIQAEFKVVAGAVEAVRERNIPRLQIRVGSERGTEIP